MPFGKYYKKFQNPAKYFVLNTLLGYSNLYTSATEVKKYSGD